MAQLTIKINGFSYTVGCADGEEEHLTAMAGEVEARVTHIKTLGTQSGEGRILAQAALLMADELHDLRIEMEAVRRGRSVAAEEKRQQVRLAKAAQRAEAIAATLDQH